jgi:hypothetical protein
MTFSTMKRARHGLGIQCMSISSTFSGNFGHRLALCLSFDKAFKEATLNEANQAELS